MEAQRRRQEMRLPASGARSGLAPWDLPVAPAFYSVMAPSPSSLKFPLLPPHEAPRFPSGSAPVQCVVHSREARDTIPETLCFPHIAFTSIPPTLFALYSVAKAAAMAATCLHHGGGGRNWRILQVTTGPGLVDLKSG